MRPRKWFRGSRFSTPLKCAAGGEWTGADEGKDTGSVLVLVIVLFPVLMLIFGGLLLDAGGSGLAAREQAADLAAAAARAGASQISVQSLGDGTPAGLRIDPAAAGRAGQRILAASGATGTITVTGPTTVRATAHVHRPTVFLRMVGIDDVSATISATATVLHGVSTGAP